MRELTELERLLVGAIRLLRETDEAMREARKMGIDTDGAR